MEPRQQKRRARIVAGIILAVAVAYLCRLFYLQVLDDSYKIYADQNALRQITIPPPRGLIYDRNDSLMVYNEAAYDLMVVPKELRDFDTADLCHILNIDKKELLHRIDKAITYSPMTPSVIEQQMAKEEYGYLQEKLYRFPGFFVQNRTLRYYPKPIAAHILGYVGEVNQEVLEKDSYYQLGDYIGISGIEKAYEEELRGKKGKRVVLVDVHNRERGSFQNGELDCKAVSGLPLWSSLDMRLQEYAEKQLDGRSGSVVAIEPATGELLCVVSSPSYDPNLLVGTSRSKNYMELLNDTKKKPLFNRALSAMYPPGSTFKLANALIGLQEGVIVPSTRFACHHGYQMGSHTVHCHHSGSLDLYTAIQSSCNGYFCKLLYVILANRKSYKDIRESYNAWRAYMLGFGFAQKFESDLPYETRGIIPTSDYFDKQYRGSWNPNTVISMGIGQGEVALTPIQMANFIAVIANRGYYIKPHVIKAIGRKDLPNKRYTEKIYCGIDKKYFEPVIKGMELVMESGTGWRSAVKGISIAGKTGTAQNPHGADHSVFACFAPVDKPKIAVFVLVENAGFGATVAAPIATSVIEYYLKDDARRAEMDKELEAKSGK